jgi:hypothetical protein
VCLRSLFDVCAGHGVGAAIAVRVVSARPCVVKSPAAAVPPAVQGVSSCAQELTLMVATAGSRVTP